MDMVAYYCSNPDCDCRDVTLAFFDANGEFGHSKFYIVLNYETWKLESTRLFVDDADYAEIIFEFMEKIGEDLKADLLAGKEDACLVEYTLQEDADESLLEPGMLVCYSDVYETEPYEQWVFSCVDTDYLVLDYYCPDPNCDCRDVLLTFQIVVDAMANDEPVLLIRVDFQNGTMAVMENPDNLSPEMVKQLYTALAECIDGNDLAIYKLRYQLIRDWSKQYY